MQEMPDCALEERMNCKPRESLYELIKEYMEITDKQYELFKKQEMGAVYQHRFYCKDDYSWCEDYEGLYESLETCWKEIDEDQDLGIEIFTLE